MIGGGARPNQFNVNLTFPSYVGQGIVAGQAAQFLCKSAQLPASTIENIQIQYRGRQVNFAGERTFDTWTVSIYNDTNFAIRNAMEQWAYGIQQTNTTLGKVNPSDYQFDMQVNQLDRNGAIVKAYNFINAYPINVGPIQLDYDTTNQIEIFDVTFQYNYWTSNTASNNGFGINTSVDTPIGTFPVNL